MLLFVPKTSRTSPIFVALSVSEYTAFYASDDDDRVGLPCSDSQLGVDTPKSSTPIDH